MYFKKYKQFVKNHLLTYLMLNFLNGVKRLQDCVVYLPKSHGEIG